MLLRLPLLLTLWLSLYSAFANAVGLGNIYLKSNLHQPLDAEIELTEIQGLGAEEIFPNIGNVDDFQRAGIYRPAVLTGLKFQTILRTNGTGFIKVTSQRPIEEPFLNFLVEVHWPNGRLLREYTLLLDPPAFERPMVAPRQSPIPSELTSHRAPNANKRLISKQSTRPNAVDPAAPQYAGRSRDEGPFHAKTYKVIGNESLLQVAAKVRPDGQVSAEQTMIALLRLNPEAFEGYNINRLKNGVTLKLPDAEIALALTHRQALWQIAMHHEAWQKHKQLPVVNNIGQKHLSSTVERSHHAIVETPVTPDSNSGAKKLLKSELILSREQADQLAQENSELRGRLQNLDQQLDSLNALVMQQDDQLTAMQSVDYIKAKKDAESKATTENKEKEEKEVVTVTPADNTKKQQKQAVKEKTPNAKIPNEKTPVEPGVVTSPQPDFFNSLLFYALSLLVPLVAAIGLIAYRRRRNDEELDEELLDVLGFGLAENPDTENKKEDGQQTNDPLQDADTYMINGQFSEAVDALKQAIEKEPNNAELIVKLLEVYAKNKDLENFKINYATLESLGNADALKSAEVSKSYFPADSFAVERFSESQSTVEEQKVPDSDTLALDLNELDEDFDPGAFDEFALDLDDVAPAPEQPTGIDDNENVSGPDIALDLNDQTEELEFESKSSDASAVVDTDHELDFDISDLEMTGEPIETANSTTESAEMPGLDFNIDDVNLEAPQSNTSEQGADSSLDMEDVGIEFEASEHSSESTSDQLADDFDELDLDDELDDLNYPTDDEVTIKLDLARAYIDMDDKEGAVDILDEVLEQGSTEQKEEARELLAQL
ncbi:MAG: hypothetical protein PUP46_06450 [Endozoicomonas sp. (ex Botrylloides leachii)]|nr:hypothetical protein [Endozoicomonas sp. (ex Botrylloides leachii)]